MEKNVSPSVLATELFNEVIRMVEARCKRRPQASEIPCDSNEGGQMIFRMKNLGGSTEKVAAPVILFPLPELKVAYYIPRQLTFYNHQQTKEVWFFQPEVGKIFLKSLIKTQKHIVVLGGAGSGKSVELLYLAHTLQEENSRLNPIL
ncbi:MAG: hypothetical protein WKG06_12750 [Segetibacter sp.]